ncbi:DHHW family protein [Caloranaerobacter azorensis]|nr:DHHW family protein [Caloranaerobacter azorensis]
MAKSSSKMIVVMFIVFIFGINSLNILTPDREFSEMENRMLSQFPKFSIKNLLSGNFTDKFEKYVADQFVFRDYWVGIKSDLERFLLKTKNNGIFFGKDGYLLEDYKKPGEQLIKNIISINNFADKLPDVQTYLLLAPNSIKIYEDKLPMFADPYDQLKSIEIIKENLNKKINFIDIYKILEKKKEEYIYFKTDHHWTMRGAYYAYQEFAKRVGFKPYSIKDFDLKIVTDSFYGTFYSKANNRHIKPDSIELFIPKFNINYRIDYVDDNKSSNSLYEYSYLGKKDKYAFFLDGNHALIRIKTSLNNGKKLVIFKDSYSHCFIPFLANHYEEIHVIDLRYYKLNIYDYIKEHKIKEVLFLYNVATFSNDVSIFL